jgi:trehalose 6-phosphate phosphatase
MNERSRAPAAPVPPELPPLELARTALFLDIDGTLLDIAPEPDAVRVPGDLPLDLARLTKCLGGALALVSGRPLEVIDGLFSPFLLPAIGCHGAEIRISGGGADAVTRAAPLAGELRVQLLALADIDARILVEDKTYSVAVHYRAAPSLEPVLLQHARALCEAAAPGSVHLLRGKCVIEVKARGFDKGTAVRALMRYEPFCSRVPVFVGDDRTDEDAIAVLPEFGGIGIAVGRAIPGAGFVFEHPGAVRAWLAGLVRQKECSA